MTSRRKTKRGASATKKVTAETAPTNTGAAQESGVTDAAVPVLLQEYGGSLGESLYKALMEGASIDYVVNDLLRIYSEGGKESVCCAILNLVGKSSGAAQAELDTTALKEDVDVTTLLEEMYARVQQEADAYPFVRKESKYRIFRTAYRRFFAYLVELGYNANILLDGLLLSTVLRWLIAMSESKARCFRHTALVALLSIVGALNGLIRNLNHRLPSHGPGKKQQVSALQESIQMMVELRNHVISQAIHQRPRDVAPEIRLLVFEHLEKWIINYDEEFAENKYFRYFGMALYDKRPEIRAEALTMIQKSLVATPESGNRMFLFLQFFSSRLVEMCSDVSLRCAQLAIGVIVLILRVYGEEVEGKQLLDNEMIDRVLLTLFDERPTIRHEAGVLLRVFIDSRVSTGDSNGVGYKEAALELLCAFAATLRAQYGEAMPERYLVDALCNPPLELPPFLESYGSMLGIVASDDASEAVVGLGLVAALLEKLRGKLDLGPLPKDDRRQGAAKKLSSSKQEMIDSLVNSLSRDVGVLLAGVLEKHRGDVGVLCGVSAVVAAMDFKAFSTLEQGARINALMTLMRKATAALPHCEEAHRNQVTVAWLGFVTEDHPMKNEAMGQIEELLKQVLKQLSALEKVKTRSGSQTVEKEVLHVWGRMSILSSLVSMVGQWDLLKASVRKHTNGNTFAELLRLILSTSMRCILWQLNAEQETAESMGISTSASQMIGEFVACIFQVWKMEFQGQDEASTALFVDTMIYLCDLCALRHYTMSQMEQDVFVGKFSELSSVLGSELHGAKEKLKEAGDRFRDGGALSEVAQSRREVSRLEASQLRVTTGVARLLLLNRLAEDVGPRIFLQWVHAPTKSVSDVFRCLFRSLRDRCNESFTLEKSILLATYHHSFDALYQMGMKLSSMHWPLPDKYYAACVSMVRFGVEFATNTGPAILQAIVAYCPKLLKVDALDLAHVLAANEFMATSSDPTVQLFISAIRRAARLEEAVNAVTPVQGAKRLREEAMSRSMEDGGGHTLYPQNSQQATATMTETRRETVTISSSKGASRSQSRRRAAVKAPVAANRVLTNDGWRVRPEEEEETAPSKASSVSETMEATRARQTRGFKLSQTGAEVAPPGATQETVLSSLAAELDNDEVFIATQEYD
ncbi:cohesin complex subunit SA-1/2 [Trypanosoma rangeli]|uniref:Cohesin complex subunit SA-1/2 n=1 Tax=Trypanosoma rangeli TaxID=5698 RepID=A0A422NCR0_TRYRA|nr:cohesin complex subunit SA-1/2 [Trypanosoma rangeli]RNF03263.1 cohesin complex subunit SA-1/2 [Trypanosoma rangeli]|eukprot:RNF03263.1 cohesin complex subunit SA-1/2 [Trypanosoma rangeli]